MELPIAAVLVVERRRCRCGAVYDAPSANVHELWLSCQGHSPAKSVRRVPKGQFALHDTQTLYIVEVDVPHCQLCWERDEEFFVLLQQHPKAPPPRPVDSEIRVKKEPRLEDL